MALDEKAVERQARIDLSNGKEGVTSSSLVPGFFGERCRAFSQ